MTKNVAIIGASPKPERYSNMALHELLKHGHTPFLVHPVLKNIEGHIVYNNISEIPEPIDTVTMYVSADASNSMSESLITLNPKRVIFNPGAENKELAEKLGSHGIQTQEHCTLVLLKTNQF